MASKGYSRHGRRAIPVQRLNAEMKTFGWPWPSRSRTWFEYEYLKKTGGQIHLLPEKTCQPLSAARWLEKTHALWK